MSEKAKFNVELVKLTDILITNAKIINESSLPEIDFKTNGVKYSYGFDIAISEDFKNVRMIFSCRIKIAEKENLKDIKVSGEFDIAYIFTISNLKDLVEGIPPTKLDNDLLISLSNIAYSTSRGVLFTRCQGTILKQLVLPILSTKDLIGLYKENSIIE